MRWYSPETEKWLSRDPIGEMGGQNLYSFLLNTATAAVDPLGLNGNWPGDPDPSFGHEPIITQPLPLPPPIWEHPGAPKVPITPDPFNGKQPIYKPDVKFVCGPFTPPCCSAGDCLVWTRERGKKWKEAVQPICFVGCAALCLPSAISGPGFFVCYVPCVAGCEAAGWLGITAGEAACSVLCLQCTKP